EQYVQVQRVLSRRVIVEAVEDAKRFALIVQHGEFGGVEEAPRALEVEGGKIADLRAAESQSRFGVQCAELTVLHQQTASRFLLPKAGAGDCVNHQARLVAVFRRRRAGNHFQRLDSAERRAWGKGLARLDRKPLICLQ